MYTFVGHSLRHAQCFLDRPERIAIPILLQYPKDPLNRVVFAVIGRVVCQSNCDILVGAEFYYPLEPLTANPTVFWPIVGVNHQGMWIITVFLNPGQSSCNRSTIKSAVTGPVVKYSHVSLVSGRNKPKGPPYNRVQSRDPELPRLGDFYRHDSGHRLPPPLWCQETRE